MDAPAALAEGDLPSFPVCHSQKVVRSVGRARYRKHEISTYRQLETQRTAANPIGKATSRQ
jgi:hypothetical protein